MKLQGYKTYLVSVLMFVLGIVVEVLQHTSWDEFMANPRVGAGIMVMSLVTVFMRKITTVTTVKTALETPPPPKE